MKKIKMLLTSLFLLMVTIASAQIKSNPNKSLNYYCECEEKSFGMDSSFMASPNGKVLQTGYQISLIDQTIIKGSCWDFVNAVFNRSGYGETKKTIFSSRKGGPYAPSDMVRPGDWIYHINHQYNNIEHSAIFICWKDFKNKIGITLSYAGMNKSVPGKYGEYNLSHIYSIFRP